KGWNVLLVKSGVAEMDWRLRLRLHFVAPWREASGAEELREALAVDTSHSYIRNRDLAQNPDYEEWREAIQELLHPSRDRHDSFARRAMARALEKFDAARADLPAGERARHDNEHAVLCYLAAWANRSTAQYSAGREENRRRELLKQCLELDPKAARAAYELSQYYTTT